VSGKLSEKTKIAASPCQSGKDFLAAKTQKPSPKIPYLFVF
jgi:hypothetical protein